MSEAWIYQKTEALSRLGPDAAPWYCGWYDPEGHRRSQSFGPGERGRKSAQRKRREVEAELLTGQYRMQSRKPWDEFVTEYDRRILAGLARRSRDEALAALAHFKRLVRPARVFAVGAPEVSEFTARRRLEPSRLRPGELVSPATVNKELRHVKAALRLAQEWGYLPAAPRIRMEKLPGRLPSYVPPEHFTALYGACDSCRWPALRPYPAGEWWRGLLVTAYMTGWRIGQLLALRRADVDLDAATALSRAEDNKGKRDVLLPLPALVVEHLRRLADFDLCFFPWDNGRRRLFEAFHALQDAAGVRPGGGKAYYGFHDLRRGFATLNADRLTPDALQALMQHKDYQTTQVYIALARQLRPQAQNLFVPDLPGRAATRNA
jgi:integrase